MLPISLEKSGQILGDLMRSVHTPPTSKNKFEIRQNLNDSI